MRRSKSLARIRSGEIVRTCNLGHYIPAYVGRAAQQNYDCIWLDLEHRSMSTREVQAILAYAHVFDIDVMVRPPERTGPKLYRYLEDGAAGLLIPFVNTAEEAAHFAQTVKFPPVGERGLDGVGFDADFGTAPLDEYVEWALRETFLAVQIETPEAVGNIEAIAAVPGVDMLFIGPGDLSLRLKHHDGLTLDDAWEAMAAACKKHGKAFGGPAFSDQDRKHRREQGAQIIIGSGEFMSWANAVADHTRNFEGL